MKCHNQKNGVGNTDIRQMSLEPDITCIGRHIEVSAQGNLSWHLTGR